MLVETVSTPDDLEAAFAIRRRVFVEEQRCPEDEEFDEHETAAHQVLGRLGGTAVATARWRVVDFEGEPHAKLERFAVLREHRGEGHGKVLVAHLLEAARSAGHRRFLVHAQAHLERFYATFDFLTVGEPFEEAGIPHLKMVRRDLSEPSGDPGGGRER